MAIKESPLDGLDMRFNIFDARGDVDTHAMHYHDCLEIDYVYEGTGINSIDGAGYELSPGDIYLINNYEHHFAIHQKNLRMKVILFDTSLVWDQSDDDYEFVRAFFENHNRIKLADEDQLIFEQVVSMLDKEYREKRKGYKLFVRALLAELLAIIARSALAGVTEVKDNHRAYDKVKPAIEYIRNNLSGDLSLAILGELCCMSPNYFSMFFKKVMSVNVSQYVEAARIGRAQTMLITSSESITDICFECGYRSISSFNVAFRKIIGNTPGEYRRNFGKS